VAVLAAAMAAIIFTAAPLRLKAVPATAAGLGRGVRQLFASDLVSSNTALLVYNNPETCGVTRTAIEQQGYTVLVARNKKEAFDILEQKPDNVVLVVMPRRMFDRALMVPAHRY
jgi:PleD family two-component response regulator